MPAMEMAGCRLKRKVRAFYGCCLVGNCPVLAGLVARSWLVVAPGRVTAARVRGSVSECCPVRCLVASLPSPRLAAGCSDSIGQLSVRRPTLSQRGSEAVLTAVVATATDSQSTPSCAAQRVLPA